MTWLIAFMRTIGAGLFVCLSKQSLGHRLERSLISLGAAYFAATVSARIGCQSDDLHNFWPVIFYFIFFFWGGGGLFFHYLSWNRLSVWWFSEFSGHFWVIFYKKKSLCLSQNGQFDDHPGSQSDQFADDRVRQNGQSCQFLWSHVSQIGKFLSLWPAMVWQASLVWQASRPLCHNVSDKLHKHCQNGLTNFIGLLKLHCLFVRIVWRLHRSMRSFVASVSKWSDRFHGICVIMVWQALSVWHASFSLCSDDLISFISLTNFLTTVSEWSDMTTVTEWCDRLHDHCVRMVWQAAWPLCQNSPDKQHDHCVIMVEEAA